MSEEQIEQECERVMDRLDRQFLNGAITEQQYQRAIDKLCQWSAQEYSKISELS